MYQIPRLLLLTALFTVGTSQNVDSNCNFQTYVEPGRTYTISNPNYPYPYYGRRSCRWYASSNSRLRLTCNQFSIPSSENCVQDSFNVYQTPTAGPRRFCGNGGFTIESGGNELIVTLITSLNTRGGTFQCNLQAISQPSVDPPQCRCGWKNPTRIVGGVETGVNEFPMMVGIINIPNQQIHCGGTLISNKHVLTAAHCMNNLKPGDIGILVGDHSINRADETSSTRLFKAAYYTVHPGYTVSNKTNDIAVITIDGTVQFTNQVGPVCLPFQHYRDSFEGATVDLVGWGSTEFAGAPSDTLQKVQLSVTNFATCKKVQPNLVDSQICTYAPGGRDACQFDSGGPVLWRNPASRRLVVVGIIGYGTSYCGSAIPAVNTRVGAFLNWIIQATPGTQYCQSE